MIDHKALTEMLVRHEGLRLKPYRDTVGKLTLGVGRNLDDKGISEAEAFFMLNNDITATVRELNHALPWWGDLAPTWQLVLANMAFNLGLSRLLGFRKMLAALEAGDYETAAAEMLDSKWARQVGRRAEELAAIVRPGLLEEV